MKLTGSDLHLLTVFDAVVRNGGFTAAQVELGLSQPTISNHITALEERLGVKLCQRGRRGFLLTEKGRMVHEIGRSLTQTLDTQSSHLSALKGNLVGELKIGVVDCVASDRAFCLPEAINRFAQEAPAVRVDLSISGIQDVLSGVIDGTLHIGIGSFDTAVSGVKAHDLYEEKHTLYCGREHPLYEVALRDIAPGTLQSHPWVHRGYWSRRRRKSVNPVETDRFVHEIEAQLIMVLSGAYLGLLPDHLAASYVAEGRLRSLPDVSEDYICMIQMIARAGVAPKVNRLFMDVLKSCYA